MAAVNLFPAPHPPQLSSRPWKASPSPSARRASAQSLMVLSEEERAELEDCFDALAGGPTGVIGIKHITKAMELVLGPELSSDKTVKAAFDTMGPSMSGHVDRMAFRAFMLDQWHLPTSPAARDAGPPPPAQGFTTSFRRRSAEAWNLGALRLSDIVRMYRRQTLAERTLKKAQKQVQMHPLAAQADGAAVPLSRFSVRRRASMMMLEAALASEKQSSRSTQATGSIGSVELAPAPESRTELHSPSSCEDGMLHKEPSAAQSAWEQRVLSLCRLNSGCGPRVEDGAEAEVDADGRAFLPVQQLLLHPSPQRPETPEWPRGPRDPVTGQRAIGSRGGSFEVQRGIQPACFMEPPSHLSSCASDLSWAAAVPVDSETVYSTASELMSTGSSIQFAGCNVQPPDVARTLGVLDQQSNARVGGAESPAATSSLFGFEGFLTARSDDENIDSSDESDNESEAPPLDLARLASGSTGGVKSWITKRLTRFVDRDEPATMEGLVPPSGASAFLSTLSMRRSSQTYRRSASEQLGSPSPLRAGEEGRQCAMPQRAGASVESMLRRVGSSQRALLPSLSQGSRSGQGSPASGSPLGSRSGTTGTGLLASIPVLAKAKSSILDMARADKAIADVQAKLIQQKYRRRDRWNLA